MISEDILFINYLQFVIDLYGVLPVLLVRSYLGNSLLEVEDVDGKLCRLRTGCSE